MLIFPAIDLYEGKAVRLFKGDYHQMTVYSERPAEVAEDFRDQGARYMHLVDLEGARDGQTPNLRTIQALKEKSGLFTEVGGGVRSMEIVARYLEDAGVDRVILGTAAVTDPDFVERAVRRFGDRIAVGVDVRDGFVAIRGWVEQSGLEAFAFCRRMEELGVKTIVSTDISRDGALEGVSRDMYQRMSEELSVNIIASGGVSSVEDILALKKLGLYGAIIGKAYYTGAVSLRDAIGAAV
ncbi:MAG: 1-(5-phosphoribosyl)-5-[Clostridia bacterium]|nr:1-(5-phosphoribosyl)-5-[(5-phosphoribosylamino)methylideneamino]imidazole-4-carboxamide isomerase [Clostridia bacterium]